MQAVALTVLQRPQAHVKIEAVKIETWQQCRGKAAVEQVSAAAWQHSVAPWRAFHHMAYDNSVTVAVPI